MQKESAIEKKLVDGVKRAGGLCFKFVSPGNSGVPDRLVLLNHESPIFVELKRPKGGRLSAVQVEQQRRIKDLGFDVENISSVEDLERFFSLYCTHSQFRRYTYGV